MSRSSQRIKPDQLATAINRTLLNYGETVDRIVDIQASKAIKDLVDRTKRDAPVNTRSHGKHYRDQIASKTLKSRSHEKSYLWYVNGDKYRLAHLLNSGHQKRNGGRVPGDNHVTRNAEQVIAEYERGIEEAIRNGG